MYHHLKLSNISPVKKSHQNDCINAIADGHTTKNLMGKTHVTLPRVEKKSGLDPNLMNFIMSSCVIQNPLIWKTLTRPLPLVPYKNCPNIPAHHPTCYAREEVLLSKITPSGEATAIASKGEIQLSNFCRPGAEHIAYRAGNSFCTPGKASANFHLRQHAMQTETLTPPNSLLHSQALETKRAFLRDCLTSETRPS